MRRQAEPAKGGKLNRREAIRGVAATAALPLLSGTGMRELLEVGGRARAGMSTGAAALRALSEPQAELVSAVAEVILPETDTPGATSLRIGEFIDVLLGEWLDDADREAFIAGLDQLDRQARESFGTPFTDCSGAQQSAIVGALDAEVAAAAEAEKAWLQRRSDGIREAVKTGDPPIMTLDEPPHPEDLFFFHFKRFALTGYFTSEIGMKQTGYAVIPGRWDGCTEIEER